MSRRNDCRIAIARPTLGHDLDLGTESVNAAVRLSHLPVWLVYLHLHCQFAERRSPLNGELTTMPRKEANEKGLPLFIKCYSDGCYHCQRLDAGPFRDPANVDLLSDRYIPLKVDGTKSPKLIEALRIQSYPTMIIAATDGKIISFIEGYQETKALTDHLQRPSPCSRRIGWLATFRRHRRPLAQATMQKRSPFSSRSSKTVKICRCRQKPNRFWKKSSNRPQAG